MLNLSLAAVFKGGESAKWEIPADDPLWEGADIALSGPVRVEVEARPIGDGVLVRGRIRAATGSTCRRCVAPVVAPIDAEIDLLFEELKGDEKDELAGEVYPLPERGDELELSEPLREQFLLHVPDFVLCDEACRGLCPQCGADLNKSGCDCVPAPQAGPWDALKNIKFE